MSSEQWSLWHLILSGAVLFSVAICIFIFTLPSSYTHFHSGVISEKDFTEQDKIDARRSGYQYYQGHRDRAGELLVKTTVQVVVLGDIGRSPRMQYHALSLAACGATVQFMGYIESELHPDIVASRFIEVVPFSDVPQYLQTKSPLLFLLTAPLKVIYQLISLYKVLAYDSEASRYMLVQNPPAIPLLAIASFICFLRNTKLIIDWHNFGYTILALRLGPNHPLVLLSKLYERILSHAAEANFAVTHAMKRVLRVQFGIAAVTLHDRPAEQFRRLEEEDGFVFLRKCEVTRPYAYEIKAGNQKLLVSPTSWTADEDFELLLEAVVAYSAYLESNAGLPDLLVVITGKGPLKDHYAKRIRALEEASKLKHAKILQAWLTVEEYAELLGSAHLGLSLHTSSSGVDLPMKVLDMFGAGLPAAGWSRYEAWPELVQEGVNGVGFDSADELKHILISLFANDGKRLAKLRQGAALEGNRRWHDEWMKVAAEVFRLHLR